MALRWRPAVVWRCIAVLAILFLASCESVTEEGNGNGGDDRQDVYDVDTLGVPRFVAFNHIDLNQVYRMSRFRSAVGHDYSDDFESCRSMKHYFQPRAGVDWSAVTLTAPVAGSITRVEEEWAGQRVEIQSDEYPAFRFILFHVSPFQPLQVGDTVAAGQVLGTHIGSQTNSDIAVGVTTPGGWKLVSFLETLTDAAFAAYINRGLGSRGAAIITRAQRDADPLTCSGETILTRGHLADWIVFH